jgi:hypothetical protein
MNSLLFSNLGSKTHEHSFYIDQSHIRDYNDIDVAKKVIIATVHTQDSANQYNVELALEKLPTLLKDTLLGIGDLIPVEINRIF